MDSQQNHSCWKLELENLENDSSWVSKFDPSKKKKKKKKQIGLIASFDIDITEKNASHGHNFEPDYSYEELLSRVFGKLREEDLEVSIEKKPRTVMMPPQLLAEGTQRTLCLNFADLCRTMHRNPDHVMRFLLSQMETTKGFLNKQQKLEMNGLVSSKDFQAVFRRYIDTFVICSCCKSPDTDIAEEDNGLLTLKCDMCGLVASIKEDI